MQTEKLRKIYQGSYAKRFADGGSAYANYSIPDPGAMPSYSNYASYAQQPTGSLLNDSSWNSFLNPSNVTPTTMGTGYGTYTPTLDPTSSLFNTSSSPYASAALNALGSALSGASSSSKPSQNQGALGSLVSKAIGALGLNNQGNIAGLSLISKLLGALAPALGATGSGGTNAVKFNPQVPVSSSQFSASPASSPYVLHNYINTPGSAYSAPAQNLVIPSGGWSAYGQGPQQPLVQGHADGGSISSDPSQAIWEYAQPAPTLGVAARGVGPHGIAPQVQQPLSPVPQPPQPNGMPAQGPNLNAIAPLTPQRPMPPAPAAPMPWQRLDPAMQAVLSRMQSHYAKGGEVSDAEASHAGAPSPYHYVRGGGDGTSDSIPARLADGEYVIDAQTVSMLGNGSNEAGARRLDEFRRGIRAHKGKALARGKMAPNAKPISDYMRAAS